MFSSKRKREKSPLKSPSLIVDDHATGGAPAASSPLHGHTLFGDADAASALPSLLESPPADFLPTVQPDVPALLPPPVAVSASASPEFMPAPAPQSMRIAEKAALALDGGGGGGGAAAGNSRSKSKAAKGAKSKSKFEARYVHNPKPNPPHPPPLRNPHPTHP